MTYLMILVITMRTPEIGNTAYKILKGIFITEEAFVAFEATLIPPKMKTYTTKKIMAALLAQRLGVEHALEGVVVYRPFAGRFFRIEPLRKLIGVRFLPVGLSRFGEILRQIPVVYVIVVDVVHFHQSHAGAKARAHAGKAVVADLRVAHGQGGQRILGAHGDALDRDVGRRRHGVDDDDARAGKRGAGLPHELHESQQRVALGKEIVDDEHVVAPAEVMLRDHHVVGGAVREGIDGDGVHVGVDVFAFRLLREHDGAIKKLRR